jgi:hypothetical protein
MEKYEELNKKILAQLNQAKELSHTFNNHIKDEKDLEVEFLKEYKGKNITLITPEGEIQGILEDINRFRIEINNKKSTIFYNKSSLLGFYAKA